MATTAAYLSASAGSTSGSGLARAKTTGLGAMVGIHSGSRMPGARHADEDVGVDEHLVQRPGRPARVGDGGQLGVGRRTATRRRPTRAPSRSTTTTSVAPAASSSVTIAVPAAPAPETTIRTSASSFSTQRSALVSAASTTIAVPCWSSWKTGMSSDSRSRRSISKQRGAAMSSRLMPPKPGAIISTALTISSVSWRGQADRPGVDVGEALEQRGLALHHRHRGAGTDVAEARGRPSRR